MRRLPWWWWLGVGLLVGYDDAVRLLTTLGFSDFVARLIATGVLLIVFVGIVGAALNWIVTSSTKLARRIRWLISRGDKTVALTGIEMKAEVGSVSPVITPGPAHLPPRTPTQMLRFAINRSPPVRGLRRYIKWLRRGL